VCLILWHIKSWISILISEYLIHHLVFKYYLFVHLTVDHDSIRHTLQALKPLNFRLMRFLKFNENEFFKLIFEDKCSVLENKIWQNYQKILLWIEILILRILPEGKVSLNSKWYKHFVFFFEWGDTYEQILN
jgi:hypothetical protein